MSEAEVDVDVAEDAGPDAAPPPPAVAGHVDAWRRDGVYGWAWYPECPDARVELELRHGETLVAVFTADQHRADLAASGVGDGGHAFECPLPPKLADVPPAELSVVVAGTGEPLPRSDLQASSAVLGDVAERLAALEGLAGALAAQSSNACKMAEAAAHSTGPLRQEVARLNAGLAALAADLDDRRERETADLRRRFEETDTFLMRHDRILADMPDRLDWERSLRRDRRMALLLNLVVSVLSAAVAAAVVHALLK